MEFMRWAGLRGHDFILPPFIEGTVDILRVPVDIQRLIIIGVTAAVVLVLWLFTHYNRIGLSLRAIAQDERAALMLGIDSDQAAIVALSLGSALAGLAAILILPLGNVTVETGYEVLTFAIAVAVCGGLGSWLGSVIAAFVIGYAQMITVHYIAPHYHMVVAMLRNQSIPSACPNQLTTVAGSRIMLVKIRALREKDMTELKRSINRLKTHCAATGGDMAAIDDNWVIVVPPTVEIERT